MGSSYSKPHLSFDKQLALLEDRGLEVADREAALRLLQSVGYYTLGGYLYPMRVRTGTGPPLDRFVEGASFEQMAALYDFDRGLRLLCIEALEAIERRIKVAVAYTVGEKDPFAHDSGSLHDRINFEREGDKASPHERWRSTHRGKIANRHSEVISSFVEKYGQPLPMWVAIDAMDFGDVSKLLSMFGRKQKNAIAREFGLTKGRDMASWTRTMCGVRNISAHHDRLWNRTLVDQPTRPSGVEAVWFPDVLGEEQFWSRCYMALLIIALFAREIDPETSWPTRVAHHLLELPEGNGVSFLGLGAPFDWIDNPTWQLT